MADAEQPRDRLLNELDMLCRTMARREAGGQGRARGFVFIADDAGRVQFVDAGAIAALGLAHEEIIGRRVEEFLEPGGWALQRLSVSEVVRSGEPLSFQGGATLADRELLLHTTLEPIVSDTGEVRAASEGVSDRGVPYSEL